MPHRILLVDDQEDLLRLLETALVNSGYEVVAESEGKLARRALRTQEFDLLICDVVMPDVTGYELLHEASRDLPVIMMSGNFHAVGGRELFEKSAKGLGCVEALSKPFTPAELVERVASVLADPKSRLPRRARNRDDNVAT